MSENKEMPLKRREIWCESMEGHYDINTQMKGNPRGEGKTSCYPLLVMKKLGGDEKK